MVFQKLPKAHDKDPPALTKDQAHEKDPPAIKSIKNAPSLTDQVPVKKLRGKVGTDFSDVREGFL